MAMEHEKENLKLNENEMDQVNGGRIYIVYDKDGSPSECFNAPGVWHSYGRGKSCRRAGAVSSLSCGAG